MTESNKKNCSTGAINNEKFVDWIDEMIKHFGKNFVEAKYYPDENGATYWLIKLLAHPEKLTDEN